MMSQAQATKTSKTKLEEYNHVIFFLQLWERKEMSPSEYAQIVTFLLYRYCTVLRLYFFTIPFITVVTSALQKRGDYEYILHVCSSAINIVRLV